MVDVQLVIYVLYTTLVLGIAVWGYRRVDTAEDILVAGFGLPLPFVTGTLIATFLSASYFFAALGLGFDVGGWEATAVLGGLGLTLVIGGFVWTRPLRRLRAWTMSDYYYLRYDRNPYLGAFAGLLLGGNFMLFQSAAVMSGGAFIIMEILDVGFAVAVFLVAGITATYSILGGLWAVAYTDAFQAIVAGSGILVASLLLFGDVGFGTLFGADHWNTPHLATASGVTFWSLLLVYAIGDLPAADLGQRVAGSDSPNTARKAMMIAGVFVVLVSFLPGLIGEALQPLYDGGMNGERLFLTYIAEQLNPVLGGLVLAALGAAAMSTIDTVYVAGIACITKNVYLDHVNSDPDGDRLLLLSRAGIGVTAIAGAIIAVYFQNILFVATLGFELTLAALVWPLVLGVFWRRVSAGSALASVVVGSVGYLYTYVYGAPLVTSVPAGLQDSVLGLLVGLWANTTWVAPTLASLVAIVAASLYFEPSEGTLEAYRRQRDGSHDHTDVPGVFGPGVEDGAADD